MQVFLGESTSRTTVVFLYLVCLSDLELSRAEPQDFSWSIYSFCTSEALGINTADRQAPGGGAGGVWRAQSHKCSQEVLEIPFINTASYRKNLKAQINHFPYAYVYINSTGLEDLIRSVMCLFTGVPKTSYLINSNFLFELFISAFISY